MFRFWRNRPRATGTVLAGRTKNKRASRRLTFEPLEVRATPTAAALFANMFAEIMEAAPVTKQAVPSFLGLMTEDGRFRDLDYSGRSDKSAADLQSHGKRLAVLAQSYHWDDPANPHFGSSELRSQILQGWRFAAYRAGNVNAPNWWWKAIGVPQGMADGLVLMRSEMPADLRGAVLKKYFGPVWNPSKYDGANLTYQAPIAMIDGLLRGNLGRIRDVVNKVSNELNAYRGEGIQRDLSFFQHKAGKKLNWQSGSYGLVFTRDTSRLMRWAADTDFAFGAGAVNQHLRYVLDHMAWLTRGHVFELSSQGRSITRPKQITNATAVLRDAVVDLLPLGVRTGDLLQYLDRYENGVTEDNALIGNKQLWKADTMMHQRPSLLATVRMISNRTVRPETAAGENTKGFFLGDGFTMLLQDGEEYGRRGEQDIIPVWNFQRIPGTTIEQNGMIPYYNMFGGARHTNGGSSLVGSASSGQYGVAAMDYVRSGVNVTARKAWFFFDNEVVALGAAINGTRAAAPVITTMNQVLLDGPVTVQDAAGNRQTFDLGGSAQLDGQSWIHHDRMGYVILGGAPKATVQAQMQSGGGVSLPVFTAWVDHGTRPMQENYAYAVVPDVSVDDLEGYASALPFTVLLNNRNVQAVRHDELQQTQIAFYGADKVWISPDTWISANQPAMVIVRDLGDALEITASDPRQTARSLVIETNRRLVGSGAKWNAASQATRITLSLPTGQFAGSSVTRMYAAVAEPVAVYPEADAFVRAGRYAGNNYGAWPTLYAQRSTADNTRESFLRFDLSNVQGDILFAEVRLKVVEAKRSVTVALAEAGNDTWQEELVRFSSKPGTLPEIGRAAAMPGKWISFDVTDQVQAAAAGDQKLSLRLYAPAKSWYFAGFASREHADHLIRPVLDLYVRGASENAPAGSFGEAESAGVFDESLASLYAPPASAPPSLGQYVSAGRLGAYLSAGSSIGPSVGPYPLQASIPAAAMRSIAAAPAIVPHFTEGDGKQFEPLDLLPAAVDAALGSYLDPEGDPAVE